MNKRMDTDLPGGWEAAAAEYSLGLMPRQEIARFEARLAAEPDLQQDVTAWSEYFASFTDLIPEQAPPPQLLKRIESQVFGATREPPVWGQVLPYLIGAIAGAAIAWVVFASGLLEPQAAVLRADLVGDEGGLALGARFEPGTGVLSVGLDRGGAGEGEVLELWLMPEEGAPVSLALLRTDQTLVALPPAMSRDLEGARLMVSVEPLGGAPGGVPTGAARAEGVLSAD